MSKDKYTKNWIIETGIPIVKNYGSSLTLRSLYYRLVAEGMTNSQNHYKRVVNAMIEARWQGLLRFEAFEDHERETLGITKVDETSVEESVDEAKSQIKAWATSYRKNRWENQPIYPEVFIEKKALQGLFEGICAKWDVALSPCKGYPSLTFLNDASKRFYRAERLGKRPLILYFGDYDCSGEDIPRSIKETLEKMDCEVEVKRVALMEHQVKMWKLPPAPTKDSDTRSKNWDGLGQVELDAVEPRTLRQLIDESIQNEFDSDLYDELIQQEESEIIEFKSILKKEIKSIL